MSRTARRVRRLILAVVIFVVLVAVAGIPLYVFPPRGNTENADLLYVIGPATSERIALAEELRGQGLGPAILVSVDPPDRDQFSAAKLSVCGEAGVTCGVPEPLKTRGEAQMLADYARTHTVNRAVVITYAPQVMRARFIFAKCYSGGVSVVAVDDHLRFRDWAYQYAYQTAAFLKAFVKPCPG